MAEITGRDAHKINDDWFTLFLAGAFGSGAAADTPAAARGFEADFDTASGVAAALILDYSGVANGQYFANDDNTKTFGDLHTFTRASLATQKNSSGTLVFAPHNLALQAEDMSTTWTATSVTVGTNDETAPNGTATADKLTEGSGGTDHRMHQAQTFISGASYRAAVYAKDIDRRYVTVSVATTGSSDYFTATFDLQLGTTLQTGDNGVNTFTSASMTLDASGFYLCEVIGTPGATSGFVFVALSEGGAVGQWGVDNYSGDGASAAHVWGYQFGATPMAPAIDTYATTYVPTTTAAVYQHRLDHDKDGNRIGLAVEEARTNLQVHSAAFDNVAWTTQNVAVVGDDATSPDGTTTADKLTDDATDAAHNVFDIPTLASATDAAFSMWAKAGTKDFVCINYGAANLYIAAVFDLSAGAGTASQTAAFGTGSTIVSTKIEDWGNGWYRCILVGQINSANGFFEIGLAEAATGNSFTAFGETTYIGSSQTAHLWGAQMEAGTFATSYIPTTTASVTRAAEDTPAATSGWDFSATVGSIIGVVTPSHTPDATTGELILFSLNDNTANEVIEAYVDTSANVRFRVTDGGVDQCDIDSLVNAVGGTELKIGISWAASDFAISVDGATIAVDTGGTLPTVTQLDPGINGHSASIAQYKATLSDADLVAGTT